MTCATLLPAIFAEKYIEFRQSYSGPQPIFIHYYHENSVTHFSMVFGGVTYKTRVNVSDFQAFTINFTDMIPLAEKMED